MDIYALEKNNDFIGLSDKEVTERITEGKVNYIPKAPSRTLWQIIRANLFTSFNTINFILAIIVIIAGSPKNSIFAGVILVNTLIGIAQELRAKKTLEKLSVINEAYANVLRNGEVKKIPLEKIVLDDILYLDTGAQILADCEIISSVELEVDESMLTGESDSIIKYSDDKLFSGSFVVAGEAYAKVTSVGKETYASRLAEEAKKFKLINSELQNAINKIFRVIIWIIIPLSILLTVTQLMINNVTWQQASIGTVAGIIGMIPEGLVLLTSATFIVAIVKLAKYDTLVQELCSTEVLARVDVLCLDKTGTLTEGNLKLVDIKNISNIKSEDIDTVLAALIHNLPSNNATQKAILERYKESNNNLECTNKIVFSSKRKWGGATFKDLGTWVMGAPEIILNTEYSDIKSLVDEEAAKGRRVLLLGKVKNNKLNHKLSGEIEATALILIEDIIREQAPDVLDYFNKQDVEVKIISGDNPLTVSTVAKKAGVNGWENAIDARNLPENEEKFNEMIKNNTVFGRVTPHQKKRIVKSLQNLGHTVAMTGDGVNDVLALKESDCGIAMANGSDATKAVAQLVLLKSDFSALPKVVEEGRKQINNLERVAELFLSKTVYSIILALVFSLLFLPFPVLPIQMSLVGSCAIGIPAFFLALLPNEGGVKKGFLHRILTVSIPNGIFLALFTTLTFIISLYVGTSIEYSRTLALLMFAGVSMIILLKVSRPLTTFKFCLVVLMFGIVVIAFITPIGRVIFTLEKLKLRHWIISLAVIILSAPLITKIVDLVRKKVIKVFKFEY
ncbi:cation-translocating P-type ATPase [Clostridium botulinum]|uniref:cation-translocating P-type ATPase n=1 Tax=Clostridium sp. ZBS13 TaxID=2949971 RepID=UPI001DC4A387|nr:cation-translocating P-type ATPase [Clostridium sp. ZBS13]MBN1046867.1 cation-translocating P-type ATPase [Clostridium botulinum]